MTAFTRLFDKKTMIPLVTASLALGLLALATPAEARPGRGGGRVHVGARIIVHAPLFYGVWGVPYYYPYYYGPYGDFGPYPPRPYPAEGGMSLQIARLNGWGAVDFDIKPRKAEVWVDGRYVAPASELDGYPSYLWLDEGQHTLTIYRGGYLTYEQSVEIYAGEVIPLKLKMVPGVSEPPPKR